MADSVLAAQMYTVREFTETRADLEETFKKIADIGYQAVQLSAVRLDLPAQEMKALLDEMGLRACATHVSFDELRDNPEKIVADHKILECQWTGTGRSSDSEDSEQGWIDFAREATEVARKVKPMGLNYVYHNHSHEFERFGERTAFEVLYEESDPECFYFELDTYWVAHGGASPVAWINKLGSRVPLLHLKDMTMHGREQFMAEVGEGNLDWDGILAAAQDAGVKWYIVEQDTCERDPFESLAISFNNLKAMGID